MWDSECDIILARGAEAYRLTVPVQVVGPDGDDPPFTLLGRKGVFDRFDVTFRERRLRVELAAKDPTLRRVPLSKALR